YTMRCAICTMAADFEGAEKHLGEAVELGFSINSKETQAFGKAHLSNTLTYMTRFDEAWQAAQDALRISRESANREREADVLTFSIPFYYLRNGDLEAARQAAEEGVALSTRIGAVFPMSIGSVLLGAITRLRGEYDGAMEWNERAIQVARPIADFLPFALAMPLSQLGSVCLEVSDKLAGRA